MVLVVQDVVFPGCSNADTEHVTLVVTGVVASALAVGADASISMGNSVPITATTGRPNRNNLRTNDPFMLRALLRVIG